ncbi:hypothetical protein ACFWE3_24530 [Mycobacteriaceae bacterium NPDC060252]
MITHAEWDRGQLLGVVSLIVFAPLVALRIRQSWRHRSSVPAVAAGALATVLYLSWLSGVEWVWQRLPVYLRASGEAVWPIATAACLHVLIVSLGGDFGEKLRCRTWGLIGVAAIVLVVVIGIGLSTQICMGPDLYTCSSSPRPFDRSRQVAMVIAAGYLVSVLAHCTWLGFRRADRTSAGWGMGLLACGCLLYMIPVIHGGLYRQLTVQGRAETFASAAWLEARPATAGTVLILAGFLYPPIAVRLRALRELRQLAPLWEAVVIRYPDLALAYPERISLPEKVSERVAGIQDAMTLTAQQRQTRPRGTPPPPHTSDRAAAIARWLHGHEVPQLNGTWLTTPTSVHDDDWVMAIAAAYRR